MNKIDVKFTCLLDKKTYERARKEAYDNRVSISMIIRKSLQELFLRKDLKEIFEKMKK